MFENVSFEELTVFDETTGQNKKEFIAHYGTPRHSGRYPWGSGKNPQRHRNWVQKAEDLEAQGLSPTLVAKAMGLSTGEYRAQKSNFKAQIEAENRLQAMKWRDKGVPNTTIAERLGVSEGTVRNYLDPRKKQRENVARNIADQLKSMLDEKPYLDIGEGVPRQLGISDEQMLKARLFLEDEGYSVLSYKLPQVSNPSQKTNMLVLCAPGTTKSDLREHLVQVTSPDGLYFEENGTLVKKLKPIPSVKAKRIAINYTEDGGGEKDGVIEIRPGVEDLTLGNRNYAQVRIAVNGTHYLKGMAVYGTAKTFENVPEGVDIIFNTSKHKGVPMLGKGGESVLKEMKKDEQNPFGASFKQWDYAGADGKEHTSPINIVNDDEDWAKWKKNLSSQFLSKQPAPLIKQQLDIRYSEFKDEFDELKSITNPTIKKELIGEFADKCDSAARHLQAAALPRQGSFAILPVTSLKNNEVFAPMYENGEEVILIRHPHGGIFEIPRLIVNNRNREGLQVVGKNAPHAIGINSNVAAQLSGADYDGDTVLVIPTKGQKLMSREPLEGLKTFNHMELYSRSPDDPRITGKTTYKDDGSIDKIGDNFNKGKEMGQISNLITDMTLKGADFDQIERAVKHSMVIIDAEKHNLDWQLSYNDNGIEELKKKWQIKDNGKYGGASTLISRANAEAHVPEFIEPAPYKMTPEEKKRYEAGEKVIRFTGKSHAEKKRIDDPAIMTPEELERYNSGKQVWRKTGKIKENITDTVQMDMAKDAYELSSGNMKENLYAAHANKLKALANEARKEERSLGTMKVNKSAKETYEDVIGENGTLTKKIKLAELEAPKERQAQAIARSMMDSKLKAEPELNDRENREKYKKLASKALQDARDLVNGGEYKKRFRIILSDREWEAIQAGSISTEQLKKIMRYSDKEELKKRAVPRRSTGMRTSTKTRARLLLKAGWSTAEVAAELGVSWSTLESEGLLKSLVNPENTGAGGE